jgi:hypothetical protein
MTPIDQHNSRRPRKNLTRINLSLSVVKEQMRVKLIAIDQGLDQRALLNSRRPVRRRMGISGT